jgi:predicted metal-dependent hydrolase
MDIIKPDNRKFTIDFPTFIPRKIDHALSKKVYANIPSGMQTYYDELLANGWSFYAVNMCKWSGLCYSAGVITISTRTLTDTCDSIRLWVLAHEMSHAYAGHDNKHNVIFMQWLKRICPAEHIHHELAYKPRNAAMAGIMPVDF